MGTLHRSQGSRGPEPRASLACVPQCTYTRAVECSTLADTPIMLELPRPARVPPRAAVAPLHAMTRVRRHCGSNKIKVAGGVSTPGLAL